MVFSFSHIPLPMPQEILLALLFTPRVLLFLTVCTSVALVQAIFLAVLACVSSIASYTRSAFPCPLHTAARTSLEKCKSDFVTSLLKTRPATPVAYMVCPPDLSPNPGPHSLHSGLTDLCAVLQKHQEAPTLGLLLGSPFYLESSSTSYACG